MPSLPSKMINAQREFESLEYLLTQFQQQQSENLQLHEQYISYQMEYIKTFSHLTQQQNSLLANNNSSTEETLHLKSIVIDSLNRNMMQFNSHQSNTLRIHEQYLQYQQEYCNKFFQEIQKEYSKLVLSDENHQSLNVNHESHLSNLQEELLSKDIGKAELNGKREPISIATEQFATKDEYQSVTSTQTIHFPSSNLPTTDKLESDYLSLDNNYSNEESSSKKVNSTKEEFNHLTLALATKSIDAQATTLQAPQTRTLRIIQNPKLYDLGQNLLNITSDKTGYPVEMLELDMDMEADLGIDSIKRVEIFVVLRELYPDLFEFNLEELADKRTIGQIVEYLLSLTNNVTTQSEAIVSNGSILEEDTVKLATTIQSVIPSESVDINLADLGQNLLNITSDKTGYPVEMLELDMDMEADLGIDSIKRVEIFVVLRELYPDLFEFNLEELAEKRTIGQIVEYLQSSTRSEKKKLVETQTNLDHNIVRGLVKLKILPSPDFWDFTLPQRYISLITDDGSPNTASLAQSLTEQGWKVVVLSFPESLVPQKSPLHKSVDRIVLANMSEEHLQLQLAQIAKQYGNIGAFIHLHPVFELNRNGGIHYSETEKAIVQHIFLIAKHLKESLNEAARYQRSCFCTVARLDGAFGLEYKENYSPISAGLFGLTKSLKWEWQRVFCRAIDLNPTIDIQQSTRHIIAELHDPNLCLSEVAYGSQGRVTLVSD